MKNLRFFIFAALAALSVVVSGCSHIEYQEPNNGAHFSSTQFLNVRKTGKIKVKVNGVEKELSVDGTEGDQSAIGPSLVEAAVSAAIKAGKTNP